MEEEERKRQKEQEQEERRRAKDSKKFPPPASYDDDTKVNFASGEEAYLARGRLSGNPNAPAPAPIQKSKESSGGGESVAERMMLKMGWKGKGLGKEEQGISTPLTVEKTSKNQGYIRPDPVQILQPKISIPETVIPEPPVNPNQGNINLTSSSTPLRLEDVTSRVVLLRNMVGPGEVDDRLQEETAEECCNFGKVLSCLIYEVPGKLIPDDQAVRIFVKFAEKEYAFKALQALNGRFFAKRRVKATMFDEMRFEKLDLAPRPEEFRE